MECPHCHITMIRTDSALRCPICGGVIRVIPEDLYEDGYEYPYTDAEDEDSDDVTNGDS